VIPTFDRLAIHLEAGCRWRRPRSTISRICTAIEGEGFVRGPAFDFDWRPGDMLVVPGWHDSEIEATRDAVLVQVSDQPLLSALNWVRGEPGR
jgi:gentisate 1,2-dioxygenase